MIEDITIVLGALRERRDWIEMCLPTLPAVRSAARRIELARLNAEIARRCWNRTEWREGPAFTI
jgi:hypothetical protein